MNKIRANILYVLLAVAASGWCWFVVRENYCCMVGGWCWFGVRKKYCWLVEEAASRTE